MVDYKQVSVAVAVGRGVRVEALAVAVARVAVEARAARAGRAKSLERRRAHRYAALENLLTLVEFVHQSLLLGCRSLVLVATGVDVLGSSQFSAGIPFIGREVTLRRADILRVGLDAKPLHVLVGAGRQGENGRGHDERIKNVLHFTVFYLMFLYHLFPSKLKSLTAMRILARYNNTPQCARLHGYACMAGLCPVIVSLSTAPQPQAVR